VTTNQPDYACYIQQNALFSAEMLGIYKPGYHVLSGEQMDALQPHELDDVIERVRNMVKI
jgi:hypothetical protein